MTAVTRHECGSRSGQVRRYDNRRDCTVTTDDLWDRHPQSPGLKTGVIVLPVTHPRPTGTTPGVTAVETSHPYTPGVSLGPTDT